jgi:ATP-dependent DNA helicase RecG
MALPVNIDELIHGRTVEWERVELKEGWNVKKVIQSICAFANDYNNFEGGYIVIGFKEENGKPVFPPVGIREDKIDEIQLELLNYCRTKITPSFVPLLEPFEVDGKMILVIWVPAGYEKPYKAAESISKGAQKRVYIRRLSSTVVASDIEERGLLESVSRIPFVDRRNHEATLDDLDRYLIVEYLETIGSSLAEEAKTLPMDELARKLRIASGPDEALMPKNIGLLFFNNDIEQFFYKSRIELVMFSDEEGADNFNEKTFTGPLHKQLKNALEYIKNNMLMEHVDKVADQAEAVRFFNFPYGAIEEALVNAVYHKSYQEQDPVEVRVYPSRIVILSYPGPLPPISEESMSKGKFDARKYRNPRMGDMFKELGLAEAKGSGVPKIKKELKANGSPKAEFNTDAERSFFETILYLHPSFMVEENVVEEVGHGYEQQDLFKDVVSEDVLQMLNFCITPQKREDVLSHVNLSNSYNNHVRHIMPLLSKDWLRMTVPDKPKSSKQKYITTDEGRKLLG